MALRCRSTALDACSTLPGRRCSATLGQRCRRGSPAGAGPAGRTGTQTPRTSSACRCGAAECLEQFLGLSRKGLLSLEVFVWMKCVTTWGLHLHECLHSLACSECQQLNCCPRQACNTGSVAELQYASISASASCHAMMHRHHAHGEEMYTAHQGHCTCIHARFADHCKRPHCKVQHSTARCSIQCRCEA